MNRVLLPFPPQRALAEAMASPIGARLGRLDWRRFPDRESLVTIDEALKGAYQEVLAAGVVRVVSTNSIKHASNAISIAPLLAEASAELFGA